MSELSETESFVVLVNSNGMSPAESGLSHKLIQSYLSLLDLDSQLPDSICFYGEGVRLLVEGSPVLEELNALAERGVDLVGCGTCLNYFDLAQKRCVGRTGTMRDIIAAQLKCGKVITI